MQRSYPYLFFLIVFVLLPTVACSRGGETIIPATQEAEPVDAPATAEPTVEAEEPDVVESDTGAITAVEDVQRAVVQIVAEGSFEDPQVGTIYNAAGRGSGFIIDPSGIAVTNNHVVTGAGLLRVHVAGEAEPRNARVLGVSECSDLAVIDIEGEGYPYLTWHEGPINTNLDVRAAGFPLGDPEFTLTSGIVSKADADGETQWASVDRVLMHDATINPGNSGGPLVSLDAQVVGVNYAGSSATNQYFAVHRDEAQRLIAELQQENDVNSIGINGLAVADAESGVYGIWVSSVESGSPADRAGIRGGDILTKLEGLLLAQDGTMSTYCDVLRSRRADDVMRVEVLRFQTMEMLEGQLNGDPLVQTVDFSQMYADSGDDGGQSGQEAEQPAVYANYTTINDDSGLLAVEVPAAWTDVDGSEWIADDGTLLGPSVAASTNLDSYYGSWSTPGMTFAALTDLGGQYTMEEVLDLFDYSGECEYAGREAYSDPAYTGYYDVWANCGGIGTTFIVIASEPSDQAFINLVSVQAVSDADFEALDHILDTFFVTR